MVQSTSARLEILTTRDLWVFSQILRLSANPSIADGPNLVFTVIDHSPTLSYTGPLQKTCPCVKSHKGMRGTSTDGLFLSQSATSLSSKFWKLFFWSGNCRLRWRRGDALQLSFSQHQTTATRGGFITQYSLQALEGGHSLQEHSEGFRVGRRYRAVLQKGNRWLLCRGLWTHLYHGMLAAGIIFFWLRHWFANFEKTSREEERFGKVDERVFSHTTNYKRGPGSK